MKRDLQKRLSFQRVRKGREKKEGKGVPAHQRARSRKKSRPVPPISATSMIFPGYVPVDESVIFLDHLHNFDPKLRRAVSENRITTCAHFESFLKGWNP